MDFDLIYTFDVLNVEALDQGQRQVLAYDLRDLRDEMFDAGTSPCGMDDAERELLRRIGGQNALPSYVASLMAGARRPST